VVANILQALSLEQVKP